MVEVTLVREVLLRAKELVNRAHAPSCPEDDQGEPVRWDDARAVAWDVHGAVRLASRGHGRLSASLAQEAMWFVHLGLPMDCQKSYTTWSERRPSRDAAIALLDAAIANFDSADQRTASSVATTT